MTCKNLIIGVFTAYFIMGCGGSKPSNEPKSTTLIDALTDFSIAINANNFEKAVDFLVEPEKNELVGPNGKVTEENQRKLKALRLQVLIKNPRIQLSGNKISGMLSALPNLQHGASAEGVGDPLEVDTQLENVENSDDAMGEEMPDEGSMDAEPMDDESMEAESTDDEPMDTEPMDDESTDEIDEKPLEDEM